jgi:MoaA/NifB/PqqE/SkfB family radical SAM enzyme
MNIFGTNKLWAWADRVVAYRDGKVPPPVTMELDLTDRCNHKCPQCIGGRAGREMNADDARHILVEMAEYGVQGVMFTGGGEPLMHEDCAELCGFAAQQGLRVGLITNGTLIGTAGPLRGLERALQEVQQMKTLVRACEWIRVSLDASDSVMYQAVHGVDGFDEALNAIGALRPSKTAADADCTIGVGYLTSAETKRGMLSATKEVRNRGADYIQFRPCLYDETDIDDVLPVCRQYETETFKVLASEQKYRHFANWRRPYKLCHGAHFVGVVQADGSMPLCCHYRDVAGMEIGNVLEHPLAEIWESQEKQDLIERTDVQKCVPFCRADHINRELKDAVQPKTHAEFL